MAIERILKAAVDRGASDVHIKAGDVVRARIDGRLVALTRQALTPEQTQGIVVHLLGESARPLDLTTLRDHDRAWAAESVGRFRVTILRQRGTFAAVCRVIPEPVPTLSALHLPRVLTRLARGEQGLVLVTGRSGAGKSSTMAALVHEINANHEKHIVTLERPIEFLHVDLKGSVTQRDVGSDTASFGEGLEAALRHDPDVILLGALPDADTMGRAITAAAAGHLVIASLPTPDVSSTLGHLLSSVPPEVRPDACQRLAETLTAVVSQRLLPHRSGKGRVVATEVLVVTEAIRALLAAGRIGDVRDAMAAGSGYGMRTFAQHLAELVNKGEVSVDAAKAAAPVPGEFERLLHAGKGRRTPLRAPAVAAGRRPPAVPAAIPAARRTPPRGVPSRPLVEGSDRGPGSGLENLFGVR